MKVRVYFLIVATFLVFHLPLWEGALVLIGYYLCERIDRWLSQRAKDRIFDQEAGFWEVDPEDPKMEARGAISRVRLDNKVQIIVTRITEFIRRLD
jgi:hypothetical protein